MNLCDCDDKWKRHPVKWTLSKVFLNDLKTAPNGSFCKENLLGSFF